MKRDGLTCSRIHASTDARSRALRGSSRTVTRRASHFECSLKEQFCKQDCRVRQTAASSSKRSDHVNVTIWSRCRSSSKLSITAAIGAWRAHHNSMSSLSGGTITRFVLRPRLLRPVVESNIDGLLPFGMRNHPLEPCCFPSRQAQRLSTTTTTVCLVACHRVKFQDSPPIVSEKLRKHINN